MGYLQDHIKAVGDFHDNKLYQFINKHGMDCRFDPDKSFEITPGVAQECFKNATDRALAYENLTYVEGYVTIYGVPISHAWLIDKTGLVLEPTLRPNDAVGRIGEYFGIPFDTNYVLKAAVKNKVYGLLDPYYARKTFKRLVEGKDKFLAKVHEQVGV